MSNETKVGAFTVLGLVLLSAMLFFLSDIHIGSSHEYTVYALFDHVIGLNNSAKVRLAGVPVGKVINIESEDKKVRVTMKINGDAQIPRDSEISVSSSGFLGEKFINIMPGKDPRNFVENGDMVNGHGEQGIGGAMEEASEVMREVKQLVATMNEVVGNPSVKAAVLGTSQNMKDISENIKIMTETFARLSVQNEQEINGMVYNLNQLTASLMRASQETETMLHDFSGDGATAANLRMTVANIAATSQRIDNMAKSLEGVVTDPQTAEDLQATLHNVRQVSEKADRMLGNIQGTGVKAGVDVMYSGGRSNWMTNFDLTISPSDKSLLLLGVDDIGETNKFNAQVGMRGGAFTGRAGVVDSKVGVGIDADAGKYLRFSADAYDLNRTVLKLRARLKVAKDTYVIGQMNDVTRKENRAAYVGLRQEF